MEWPKVQWAGVRCRLQLQEFVESVVTMSRCLYAQIVSQAYRPPPDYMLPLPSEKGFAAAQLGMKLTAAFEVVLVRQCSHQSAGLGLSEQQ